MPTRLRLLDLRASRFPRVLGLCQDNVPAIASAANAVQEQLLFDKAAGEESWVGSYAEIAFSVTRISPFATLPRDIARLESVVVCNQSVALNNQLVEYLRFGNGRMVNNRCRCPDELAVYARNNVPTTTDLSSPPQYIRCYLTDAQDVGKRVLVQGTDSNGSTIFSQNGTVRAQGIFLTLDSVPVTSDITFNSITGIQKDVTAGTVQVYQVNPDTGEEVLLVTLQPGEKVAWYRRYFFSDLPCGCCPTTDCDTGVVNVKAIAKLDLIPVQYDTDLLMLTSLEAFVEEGQSIRLMEADTLSAQNMAAIHHQRAIRLLIGQSSHVNGINDPAVGFFPFANDTWNPIGPRNPNGGAWNTQLGFI